MTPTVQAQSVSTEYYGNTGENLSSVFRCRALKWLPPNRCTARFTNWTRKSEAVTRCRSQFRYRNKPCLRRHVSRIGAIRTDKHGQVRCGCTPRRNATTITLRPEYSSTELSITQEGVPAVIPDAACLLPRLATVAFILLAQLVEANIPDNH